jgi:hypothetical protein
MCRLNDPESEEYFSEILNPMPYDIPSSGRLAAIVFEPMKSFSGKYAPNLIGLEKWLPIGQTKG